jgi:hypothetical protein
MMDVAGEPSGPGLTPSPQMTRSGCSARWSASWRSPKIGMGDENEKRTGIVNPLNSASTHTMTSLRSLVFAAVFALIFKALTGFYHLQKGGERECTKYIMHSYLKGKSTNVLKSSISIMVNTSSS